MVLKKYRLISFEERVEGNVHEVVVPFGSELVKAKALFDGIYLWYLVSELVLEGSTTTEKFITIKDGANIDMLKHKFIDIIDLTVDLEEGKQGVVIYSLFKKL